MAKAVIRKLGSIGIIKDAATWELPLEAWSDGQNVRCADGQVGSFGGHSTFTTPTVTPYYLLPVAAGSAYYWVYPGLDKVYVYDGSSHTNITRQSASVDVDYTGTAADRWNGGVLNGLPVLNNGVDVPQMWAPVSTGTKLQALTGWDANWKCKVLRPFKYFLIALNMTESGTHYGNKLRWSTSADPGSVPSAWTPASSNNAGSDIVETEGFIVDGLGLNDEFIIYTEDGAQAMALVDGNDVFQFRNVDIPGMLAQGCAANFQGRHLVVGNGDVYIHDGHSYKSVIDKKNRDFLFADIDSDNYESMYVTPYHSKGEIWICYPTSGNTLPNKALIWNYNDNTWFFRDLPSNTAFLTTGIVSSTAIANWADLPYSNWADWDGSWGERTYSPTDKALIGASDNIYQFDDGTQFGGVNPTCFIERTGIDIGNTDDIHTVTRIYPLVEGDSVQVSVGSQMTPNASVNWSSPVTFDPSTDYKIDCLVTGRFHSIRFKSTDGGDWSVSGYGVEYEYSGSQ